MSQIELSNLVKKHGPQTILKNLNLRIESGEFVVFVGPSGCGKSTTLRLIAGLEEITEGTISLDQKVINDLAPRDRNIAMVFQNYALYPHLSVRDNMAFSLKMRKVPAEEIEKKVQETAQLLNLEEMLDRKPHQLSGGQRQRVAMGRAIVRNPAVFLFDEPLSNLDAKLRNQMRAEIKKLHERLKTTTIYVTHDQIEAMTLADRIVLLNKGCIEQIGSPQELYHKPSSVFVGAFLGNPPMNFLKASIQNSEVFCDAQKIGNTSEFSALKDSSSSEFLLGIRSEKILEITNSTDKKDIQLPCNVDLLEVLGATTLVHAQFNQQKIIGLTRKNHIEPQATVTLGFNKEDCHFFDAHSEKRLGP
jgi:multiple sugar transport system ATP-binding protein